MHIYRPVSFISPGVIETIFFPTIINIHLLGIDAGRIFCNIKSQVIIRQRLSVKIKHFVSCKYHRDAKFKDSGIAQRFYYDFGTYSVYIAAAYSYYGLMILCLVHLLFMVFLPVLKGISTR
jgi:hypothetical protein